MNKENREMNEKNKYNLSLLAVVRALLISPPL